MGGTSSNHVFLFDILAKANLTVNPVKSDFCQSYVEYLGHKVGQGHVTPIMAKVKLLQSFRFLSTRKNK